jgi:8-hydroxy-5-deazaflavin:NADPH oxidoreductase
MGSISIIGLGNPMDAGQLPMARAPENVALLQLGFVAHSVEHTDFFLGVNILS